ncbi:MAG TPA: phosphoribosylanthranilate isomerase [Terriglobales bacterium]|nr:phosphoribosylanthranilate isomerase [Terriglobales bacterium]
MTWIKICGITNLEDALVAVEAGADALGFVFYEKSPRNVTARDVARIIEKLPEHTEKVAVVVHDHTDNLNLPGSLTAFQWTHKTIPENFAGLIEKRPVHPFKTFIAFPASSLDETSVRRLSDAFARFNPLSERPDLSPMFEALFLDSGTTLKPGGTGNPFDWHKAVPIADELKQGPFKLVVAGGLTPGNVSEAIDILHPWGVDVSSGVEARPGKKNPEKVRAFIRAVREADKANSN